MKHPLLATLTALILTTPVQAAVRAPMSAPHGMVASDHVLASQAGVSMLKKGGNAIDAAIATSLVLAVVRNQSTGIGGGGFMVLHAAKGSNAVLDYREVAPQRASRNMYLDTKGVPIPRLSTIGYQAAAVPGLIAGLEKAWKKYGSRPWAELFQPAIYYADQGFSADAHFAQAAKVVAHAGATDELKALFFANGKLPQIGTRIRNPLLAASLRLIAAQGSQAFYRGPLAQKIAAAMQQHGGWITLNDLASYQPTERQPLQGHYRGYDILTMPPPSSGGAVLLTMLNILEGYPLGWNSIGFGSSQYSHVLAETMKHGFSDRARFMGDPAFVKIPLDKLLSKAYAQQLRERIKAEGIQPQDAYGSTGLEKAPAPVEDHGTTHFSVADRFGNVVAATETVNTYFGSQVVIPGTGILLNNQMDDFSKAPGVPNAFGLIGNEANAIAPRKKPLSSMTPTIVLKNGQPFMALGASGGPRIITGTLQSIVNVIDYGMNAEEAISAPRIHHQWVPERLYIEKEMPQDVQGRLTQWGHQLTQGAAENVVQAIIIRSGGNRFEGAADPRKGGLPAGY